MSICEQRWGQKEPFCKGLKNVEMPEYCLSQWLQYIERIHPQSIELGLDRLLAVARAINLDRKPADSFLYTISGTNGKGSCCALLDSACRAQGLSTATYTSPHLLKFNERLTLDGEQQSDNAWIAAFELVESARGTTQLTYFEYTTLAALQLITQARPDVIILEVGLGGRLDAANIWDCDCALLSSLGLDHQAYLGNTLEAIFREKIAIHRPQRPLVVGCEQLPAESQQLLQQLPSPTYQIGRDFLHQVTSLQAHNQRTLHLPALKLRRDNAACCWQALQFLTKPIADPELISQSWSQLNLRGRQQHRQCQGHELILDVGHNPQAAASLAQHLRVQHHSSYSAIIAMLADKDIDGYIDQLADLVQDWHCFELDTDRAVPAARLATSIQRHSHQRTQTHPNFPSAWQAAQINPAHTILIIGSFFTVEQALLKLFPSARQ